jgi:hypothetical protein
VAALNLTRPARVDITARGLTMDTKRPAVADGDRFSVMAGHTEPARPGVRTRATRDHDEIRRWAACHKAEPATGEATGSGPAVLDIKDGGAGIRFNFPGFARLRGIDWEEWFDNFDRHRLLFVYEEQDGDQVAQRARELWEAHGGQAGTERDDWFQAERELRRQGGGGSPSVRYAVVKDDEGAR